MLPYFYNRLHEIEIIGIKIMSFINIFLATMMEPLKT